MARLFFALWPNETIREQLYQVALNATTDNDRLVKRSNLHLTLEFLGEVNSETQTSLIEQASNLTFQQFALRFNQLDWWKKPGILCLLAESVPDQLTQLVEAIKLLVNSEGLTSDQRTYKPHVTLARKVKQETTYINAININWSVKSFVLVQSTSTAEGVDYKVINEWPLNE